MITSKTPYPKHLRLARKALFCISALALGESAFANVATKTQDERRERLEAFFQSFGCPSPHYVDEYVGAADTYAIDYRLLPAISVLESTCGIYQRSNNRWGWDSARRGFASFRSGLEYIAGQLAHGRYYKNKTLEEKVRMYNPNPQYLREVAKLMRKIDGRSAALPMDSAMPDVHLKLGAMALSPPRSVQEE